MTAAQWLTGKGAWELIEQMGPESVAGGCMPVVGIARKGPSADDEVDFLRRGDAHFYPEFVGLVGLALADALDFRRVQCVEFVFVLGPLGVDALELFGVGVATLPALEAGAFLLEGLVQHHASPLGDQRPGIRAWLEEWEDSSLN